MRLELIKIYLTLFAGTFMLVSGCSSSEFSGAGPEKQELQSEAEPDDEDDDEQDSGESEFDAGTGREDGNRNINNANGDLNEVDDLELDIDDGSAECKRTREGFVGKVYQLPEGIARLPDFSTMEPVGQTDALTLDVPNRSWTQGFPGAGDLIEWFGVVFTAQLEITERGSYQFRTTSDDGSKIYFDDRLVVDNDGQHAERTVNSSSMTLEEGVYPLEIQWFQGPRERIQLQVYWRPPGGDWEIIPAQTLSSQKECDLDDLGSFE